VGRSRQVVRLAVIEQLAEVGYGALTIEAVARRAGVGKATIYRHWASRVELIADAFEHAHQAMVPAMESGTALDRLVHLVEHVAEVVTHPLYSRCISALIEGAEHDERLRAFHHQYSATRRNELAAVIRAGIESGELDGTLDAEVAAVALLGAIFYRRLMTAEPLAPCDSGALVAKLLCPAH
jgi:AcrR family transcriptional regulator